MKLKKYKVLVRGENFLMNIDDVNQKVGFYTTRFVEAESEEEAENKVIDILRNDPKLIKSVLNKKSDSPMIYVEEIEQLKSFKGHPINGTGFAFYTEKAIESFTG